MRIDRTKISNRCSYDQLECMLLAKKLSDCPYDEMIDTISQIKVWNYGKCELGLWVDVLDRLDLILEQASTTIGTWQLFVDARGNEKLAEDVVVILEFTAHLVEHSIYRYLYGSWSHIIALFNSSNMDIILAVLGLTYNLSKRSNYFNRQDNNNKKVLLDRLCSMAETWGGVENGFGIAQCCDPQYLPPTACDIHFEYQSSTENPTVRKIVMKELPKLNKTPDEVMESILTEHNIPSGKIMSLFSRIRLACYFSTPELRYKCIRARLQALSTLCYSFEVEGRYFYPSLVDELVDILKLEGDNFVEIKACTFKTMTAIINANKQYFQLVWNCLVDSTGLLSYDGLLPRITREWIDKIITEQIDIAKVEANKQFTTGLLSFLYHLACYDENNSLPSFPNSGILNSMLELIKWHNPKNDYLTYATRAVRVTDQILINTSNTTLHSIKILIDRLLFEVVLFESKTSEQIANKSTQQSGPSTASSSFDYSVNNQRFGLMKSMLNLLKRLCLDNRWNEQMRNYIEDELPGVMKRIYLNPELALIPNISFYAMEALTNYMYSYPSRLSSMQAKGVTDDILKALTEFPLPKARDSLIIIPSLLNTLCLNSAGSAAVLKSNIISIYLKTLVSPKYLSAMKTKRLRDFQSSSNGNYSNNPYNNSHNPSTSSSNVQNNLTACQMSNSMSDLLKNHSSLKIPVFTAIIATFKSIIARGNSVPATLIKKSHSRDLETKSSEKSPTGSDDRDSTSQKTISDQNSNPEESLKESERKTIESDDSVLVSCQNLTDYIFNLSKFVEKLLAPMFPSSDSLAKTFMNQGGIEVLCDILRMPGLPFDFPVSIACASICKIFELLSYSLTNFDNFQPLFKILQESLNNLNEMTFSPFTHHSFFLKEYLNDYNVKSLHEIVISASIICIFVQVMDNLKAELKASFLSTWLNWYFMLKMEDVFVKINWEACIILNILALDKSTSLDLVKEAYFPEGTIVPTSNQPVLQKIPLTESMPSYVEALYLHHLIKKHLNAQIESAGGDQNLLQERKDTFLYNLSHLLKPTNWILYELSFLINSITQLCTALSRFCTTTTQPSVSRRNRLAHTTQDINQIIPVATQSLCLSQLSRILVKTLSWNHDGSIVKEPDSSFLIQNMRYTAIRFTNLLLQDLSTEKTNSIFFNSFHQVSGINHFFKLFEDLEQVRIDENDKNSVFQEILEEWLICGNKLSTQINLKLNKNSKITKFNPIPENQTVNFSPLGPNSDMVKYQDDIHRNMIGPLAQLCSRKSLLNLLSASGVENLLNMLKSAIPTVYNCQAGPSQEDSVDLEKSKNLLKENFFTVCLQLCGKHSKNEIFHQVTELFILTRNHKEYILKLFGLIADKLKTANEADELEKAIDNSLIVAIHLIVLTFTKVRDTCVQVMHDFNISTYILNLIRLSPEMLRRTQSEEAISQIWKIILLSTLLIDQYERSVNAIHLRAEKFARYSGCNKWVFYVPSMCKWSSISSQFDEEDEEEGESIDQRITREYENGKYLLFLKNNIRIDFSTMTVSSPSIKVSPILFLPKEVDLSKDEDKSSPKEVAQSGSYKAMILNMAAPKSLSVDQKKVLCSSLLTLFRIDHADADIQPDYLMNDETCQAVLRLLLRLINSSYEISNYCIDSLQIVQTFLKYHHLPSISDLYSSYVGLILRQLFDDEPTTEYIVRDAIRKIKHIFLPQKSNAGISKIDNEKVYQTINSQAKFLILSLCVPLQTKSSLSSIEIIRSELANLDTYDPSKKNAEESIILPPLSDRKKGVLNILLTYLFSINLMGREFIEEQESQNAFNSLDKIKFSLNKPRPVKPLILEKISCSNVLTYICGFCDWYPFVAEHVVQFMPPQSLFGASLESTEESKFSIIRHILQKLLINPQSTHLATFLFESLVYATSEKTQNKIVKEFRLSLHSIINDRDKSNSALSKTHNELLIAHMRILSILLQMPIDPRLLLKLSFFSDIAKMIAFVDCNLQNTQNTFMAILKTLESLLSLDKATVISKMAIDENLGLQRPGSRQNSSYNRINSLSRRYTSALPLQSASQPTSSSNADQLADAILNDESMSLDEDGDDNSEHTEQLNDIYEFFSYRPNNNEATNSRGNRNGSSGLSNNSTSTSSAAFAAVRRATHQLIQYRRSRRNRFAAYTLSEALNDAIDEVLFANSSNDANANTLSAIVGNVERRAGGQEANGRQIIRQEFNRQIRQSVAQLTRRMQNNAGTGHLHARNAFMVDLDQTVSDPLREEDSDDEDDDVDDDEVDDEEADDEDIEGVPEDVDPEVDRLTAMDHADDEDDDGATETRNENADSVHPIGASDSLHRSRDDEDNDEDDEDSEDEDDDEDENSEPIDVIYLGESSYNENINLRDIGDEGSAGNDSSQTEEEDEDDENSGLHTSGMIPIDDNAIIEIRTADSSSNSSQNPVANINSALAALPTTSQGQSLIVEPRQTENLLPANSTTSNYSNQNQVLSSPRPTTTNTSGTHDSDTFATNSNPTSYSDDNNDLLDDEIFRPTRLNFLRGNNNNTGLTNANLARSNATSSNSGRFLLHLLGPNFTQSGSSNILSNSSSTISGGQSNANPVQSAIMNMLENSHSLLNQQQSSSTSNHDGNAQNPFGSHRHNIIIGSDSFTSGRQVQPYQTFPTQHPLLDTPSSILQSLTESLQSQEENQEKKSKLAIFFDEFCTKNKSKSTEEDSASTVDSGEVNVHERISSILADTNTWNMLTSQASDAPKSLSSIVAYFLTTSNGTSFLDNRSNETLSSPGNALVIASHYIRSIDLTRMLYGNEIMDIFMLMVADLCQKETEIVIQEIKEQEKSKNEIFSPMISSEKGPNESAINECDGNESTLIENIPSDQQRDSNDDRDQMTDDGPQQDLPTDPVQIITINLNIDSATQATTEDQPTHQNFEAMDIDEAGHHIQDEISTQSMDVQIPSADSDETTSVHMTNQASDLISQEPIEQSTETAESTNVPTETVASDPSSRPQTARAIPTTDEETVSRMREDGMDELFLDALPEDMRREVLADYRRNLRLEAQINETPLPGHINPEWLAELPANLQEEVIAQVRSEVPATTAPATTPVVSDANPSSGRQQGASEPSTTGPTISTMSNLGAQPVNAENNAAFLSSLPPDLRREVLTDMEESQIELLPSGLADEARQLRRSLSSAIHAGNVNLRQHRHFDNDQYSPESNNRGRRRDAIPNQPSIRPRPLISFFNTNQLLSSRGPVFAGPISPIEFGYQSLDPRSATSNIGINSSNTSFLMHPYHSYNLIQSPVISSASNTNNSSVNNEMDTIKSYPSSILNTTNTNEGKWEKRSLLYTLLDHEALTCLLALVIINSVPISYNSDSSGTNLGNDQPQTTSSTSNNSLRIQAANNILSRGNQTSNAFSIFNGIANSSRNNPISVNFGRNQTTPAPWSSQSNSSVTANPMKKLIQELGFNWSTRRWIVVSIINTLKMISDDRTKVDIDLSNEQEASTLNPSIFHVGFEAALGCVVKIFSPTKDKNIKIHPQAANLVCSFLLDTLRDISLTCPNHFYPRKHQNIEWELIKSNEIRTNFWDILTRLSNDSNEGTCPVKIRLNEPSNTSKASLTSPNEKSRKRDSGSSKKSMKSPQSKKTPTTPVKELCGTNDITNVSGGNHKPQDSFYLLLSLLIEPCIIPSNQGHLEKLLNILVYVMKDFISTPLLTKEKKTTEPAKKEENKPSTSTDQSNSNMESTEEGAKTGDNDDAAKNEEEKNEDLIRFLPREAIETLCEIVVSEKSSESCRNLALQLINLFERANSEVREIVIEIFERSASAIISRVVDQLCELKNQALLVAKAPKEKPMLPSSSSWSIFPTSNQDSASSHNLPSSSSTNISSMVSSNNSPNQTTTSAALVENEANDESVNKLISINDLAVLPALNHFYKNKPDHIRLAKILCLVISFSTKISIPVKERNRLSRVPIKVDFLKDIACIDSLWEVLEDALDAIENTEIFHSVVFLQPLVDVFCLSHFQHIQDSVVFTYKPTNLSNSNNNVSLLSRNRSFTINHYWNDNNHGSNRQFNFLGGGGGSGATGASNINGTNGLNPTASINRATYQSSLQDSLVDLTPTLLSLLPVSSSGHVNQRSANSDPTQQDQPSNSSASSSANQTASVVNEEMRHVDNFQMDLSIGGAMSPQTVETLKNVQTPHHLNPISKFAERHRKTINLFLRKITSDTQLIENPLIVFLQYPRLIDFDIKRRFFRQRLVSASRNSLHNRFNDESIVISRDRIFEDSYARLHRKTPNEWKHKLVIKFHNEDGQDAGGLLREWYLLMGREIFNPNYCLFRVSPADRVTYTINPSSYINSNHLSYFKFVGRFIAKAIYDNKLLECYFTRSFYKHILGVPVRASDLEAEDYEFYKGLEYLLNNNISEFGYDLTFSTEVNEFGRVETRDLMENGRNITVNEENKKEYVRLVCQERMTGAIRKQLNSFLEGFYEIIPKSFISLFNEQELELLISGLPNIDIEDLKANTNYSKYTVHSPQIVWFWKTLESFDQEDRARFLQFITGTSKVPLGGFANLEGMNGPSKFQISKASVASTNHLPSAHTCFNTLDLPVYESYEKLRDCLLTAIRECSEGYGLA